MVQHSELGGSLTKRYIHCNGCVKACRGLKPSPPSEYAQLGTAAHTLLERVLKEYLADPTKGGNAFSHIGETIVNGDDSKFVVDVDMAGSVQVAVDYALDVKDSLAGSVMLVERDFSLNWLASKFGIDTEKVPVFGTADIVIAQPFGTLVVMDYKHGAGQSVEAEGNTQTRFYGLGVLGEDNKYFFEDVQLDIIQPRCSVGNAIGTDRLTVDQLYEWGNVVWGPAAKATQGEHPTFNSGEWCQSTFCPLVSTCPAMKAKANAMAKMVFSQQGVVDAQTLSDDEISKWLTISPMLSAFDKKVKSIARERMGAGKEIKGFKLTEGKATRSWANTGEVVERLANWSDYIYAPVTLLSPHQMEAMLKTQGLSKKEISEVLSGLIASYRGLSISSEESSKPAVLKAAKVFEKYLEEGKDGE